MRTAISAFVCVLMVGCGGDVASGPEDQVPELEPGVTWWSKNLTVQGYDVAVGADGAIYVAGSDYSGDDRALWLGKFDAAGELLWTFADPGIDGVAVAVVDDSVYVAGHRIGETGGRRVHRLDLEGEHQWVVKQPETGVLGLSGAPDGDVYVAGDDTVLQRLTGDGDIAWTTEIAGLTGYGGPGAITTSPSGELLVASSDETMWVHARGADGAALWTRAVPTELRTSGFHSVAVEADGVISVIGMVQEKEVRAYHAELAPDGTLLITSELADPVLEHVVDGADLLIGSFAWVERRTRAGELLWTTGQESCRTYDLALGAGDALVLLRDCADHHELKTVGR